MRDNWLLNHVLALYDAIVDHSYDTWNKFLSFPTLLARTVGPLTTNIPVGERLRASKPNFNLDR